MFQTTHRPPTATLTPIARALALAALFAAGGMPAIAADKSGKPAPASVPATTPAQAGAPATADATTPAAGDARLFIERSLLLAPEEAGALRLVDVHVYDRTADGVGFRYQHPDFPQVRVDVFVYPRGRADRTAVLAEGMAALREGIDYAVEQGSYTDLAYGDEADIDLARIAPDGSLQPEDDGARTDATSRSAGATAPSDADADPDATDDADRAETIAALLGESSVRLRGRRLPLRLSIDGEPLDSRAYLFYDALYLFKGRVSASPQQLPGELLDRFADRAMADIVPAFAVRNAGACATTEIAVDTTADADRVADQLMSLLGQRAGEQCEATLDTSVPAGFRATTLEYGAGDWN